MKDLIKQKISEALSASLGNDEQFKYGDDTAFNDLLAAYCGCPDKENYRRIKVFFAAEKEKRESEIKSALETIDWSFLEK